MLSKIGIVVGISWTIPSFGGSFGPLMEHQSATFPDQCCAIHLIHMNGGDFLMWGNSVGGTMTKSWTWNAFTGQFAEILPRINEDIFCCGVSQLPDGLGSSRRPPNSFSR